MALVLHQEPVPPRLLDPRIETDLQTICLKCLEKDPTRRYATAWTSLKIYGATLRVSRLMRAVNLMDRLSRTLCRNHKCGKFYMMSNILFYIAEVTLLIEIGLSTPISVRFPVFAINALQSLRFVLMALPFWRYRSQPFLPRERSAHRPSHMMTPLFSAAGTNSAGSKTPRSG